MTLLGRSPDLAEEAIELLFVEIMKWLLDRSDALVQGGRSLFALRRHRARHAGLVTWKRRSQFGPFIFGQATTPVPVD